jgi:phosphoglycolate phosphatase-like HAD superfamily hydrolase
MSKKLLVCDLDNTLYDWVSYYVRAFYALVDRVVEITGCDREQLLDDFRIIHRKHHDAEHPFALLETETIRKIYSGVNIRDIADILDPAFYAFNYQRKKNLTLYPGVINSLEIIRSEGILIVAHTESKLYAVVDRMTRLNITRYFSRIYCRERSFSEHPSSENARNFLAHFPMEKVVELSHHQRKPSPEVLLEICGQEGVRPSDAAYIGDSIVRDVYMAKRSNVTSVWAKYGAAHSTADYEKLVRVSHWTQEDILRERNLAKEASSISADYVAHKSFAEVLPALGLETILSPG